MTTAAAVSTWTIDPVHTAVEFGVQHLALTTFKGRFPEVSGAVRIDEARPENSSVEATVATANMHVLNDRFLGHLQGDDFFQSEKYPEMTFRSSRVERLDASHWKVTGDLTIRDTTRAVVLDTLYLGQNTHPFSKKTVAGFRAETQIDRRDFGLTWNVPLDAGAFYVGEQVRVTLEIEAVRQD